MTTLVAFLLFGAASLASGSPLFLVARSRGRADTVRRFAGGAVLVGLFCAALEFGSERLVSQCVATGRNPAYACIDIGATALQSIAIVSYSVVAWLTALVLWRR